MARENVELVRHITDLFNRGEVGRALESAQQDLEIDWSNSIGPLKGIYRGREAVLEMWESFLDAWEELRWDTREIIEVDDARLIVVNQVRMRGRGSGVDVEATGAQLWTIREGKASGIKLYQSKAEALEAAASG
jgi:ketosteroid isomerase-like protein